MMENTIAATHAVVTFDVALNGIIWGWMITLNMWAKSIGTGVIIVGAYLMYRYNKESIRNVRWLMPIISFVALNVFLLFTLLDLHQPLRMVNIFIHPHFTSAITVGAWMASVFTGLVTLLAAIGLLDEMPNVLRSHKLAKKARANSGLYEKLLPYIVLLALPVTLYTAIIMAQASARGLWEAPIEMVQMMLAAFMAGSATLLIIAGSWSKEARTKTAIILATSVAISFTLYMGEYLFSFKNSEVEATLAFIHLGGSYSFEFWFAMIVGYIIPFLLVVSSVKEDNYTLLRFAGILSLIGLYFAKDVWLKIPQMLPLS